MTEEEFQKIIELLNKNDTETTSLDLALATSNQAIEIASSLQENKTLKTLSVFFNEEIESDDIKDFVKSLETNNTLRSLLIDNEGIEGSIWGAKGYYCAIALANLLRANETLTSLSIRGSDIKSGGALALIEALEKNRTLKELDISYNELDDEVALAIAKMLDGKDSSLSKLKIIDCKFERQGIAAIARALAKNTTPHHLEFAFNDDFDLDDIAHFGDHGAIAFAEALEENKTLRSLNIHSCGIKNAGTLSLAAALGKNNSLEELYLTDNELGDEGVAALAEVLSKKDSFVMEIGVGSGYHEKLIEAHKSNQKLFKEKLAKKLGNYLYDLPITSKLPGLPIEMLILISAISIAQKFKEHSHYGVSGAKQASIDADFSDQTP